MSKKDTRCKFLVAYKAALKKCNTLIANNCDNLRLLTKNKTDLVYAWISYSDKHFDYLIKEKNEEDITTLTEEHEQLDSEQDLILMNLEDKIEILLTQNIWNKHQF